jgi:hypothetical protein
MEKMYLLRDLEFPPSEHDLFHFETSYIDKKRVKVSFKNNLRAKKWVSGFLKQQPDFHLRKPRAAFSREYIREFFAHHTDCE